MSALAIDPVTPSTLYAGTVAEGVFRSTNGGDSWETINTGLTDLEVHALEIDPITPPTLYAGTTALGVFRSSNGGNSWEAINTGLTDLVVRALEIDPLNPSTLYAATSSAGVFKFSTSSTLELTHLGSGGALQSDVVVFNPSSTATASGEVNFFGDDGTPLDSSIFLPGGNSFVLPPLGSATLSTNGAENLLTGSATVTSDSPISAVIRFDITGVGVAGVEASQVLTSAIAPVRRVGTLNSGVAFRNTGTSTIQVTLELKGEDGNVVSNGTETRTLAGNAKIAEFLDTLFPSAQTTTFAGTICVTAQSGQIAVIALELDAVSNVFTTLPVAPSLSGQVADQPFSYITNLGSNNVSVIETATDTVVATVAVGEGPWGVAVHPDGNRVYVTNNISNNVSVIDTTTNMVMATVTVGNVPLGIAVHPDGSRVYVANGGSSNVSVIDTATNTVMTSVPVGSPLGIVVHPDGSRVYVANGGSSNVSVIDTATNTVMTSVAVGNDPRAFGQFIGPLPEVIEELELTHLGNGGGLQSDVVVFNPSSTTTASGEVNFFDDDGTPLDSSVFLPGGNSFTLPPLSSATLSTTGEGDLFTGSATVTSDTPIAAVIRFDITGVGVAGVEASQVLSSAIAPVRRTGTLSSGVAFRNTGTSTIQVTLELKDADGDVVSNGTSTRTLVGDAKVAEFIETLFPSAQTTNFTGTICVTAQSGQISVIALELDATNNVFTTLPVSAVN